MPNKITRSISTTATEWAIFKKLAALKDISVSHYIRQLIVNEIRQAKKTTKKGKS